MLHIHIHITEGHEHDNSIGEAQRKFIVRFQGTETDAKCEREEMNES